MGPSLGLRRITGSSERVTVAGWRRKCYGDCAEHSIEHALETVSVVAAPDAAWMLEASSDRRWCHAGRVGVLWVRRGGKRPVG